MILMFVGKFKTEGFGNISSRQLVAEHLAGTHDSFKKLSFCNNRDPKKSRLFSLGFQEIT